MKHLISVPPISVPHFHSISGLSKTDWFVSSDPENKKVGSGGGTAHILSELFQHEKAIDFTDWLAKENRVIIHAGGQSRRLPAYAPLGKSLVPMPVFRWSRGQELNQRLIHLQSPLLDRILESSPQNLNTLIASGDTLIFEGKKLPEIPEADIVCFGLWLEPEKATNHGVFFAKPDQPEELQFMLQKPSIQNIQKLIHEYHFLMDIGIWLLSTKAIQILMKNSGWNGKQFNGKTPDFYDLYSEFGLALGNSPQINNPEINELKVALVNLEGGEFHHLGNTSELVSSNVKIQNRVHDQREIWHKHVKPHPSIFVLNADAKINYSDKNKNIWIENSVVPPSWKLNINHALTGIPENNWNIELEAGNSLDIIEFNQHEIVVRNYDFLDSFRGERMSEETFFMGIPIVEWLAKRNLENAFELVATNEDIFKTPLFTVIKREKLNEEFLHWLLHKNPKQNNDFTKFWLNSKRLSCSEISEITDVSIQEKSRKEKQIRNYSALASNHQNSVFYQLDLKKAATAFVANKLELPKEPSNLNQNWLPLHDLMFRAFYHREKKQDWQKEEKAAFTYLQKEIIAIHKNNTVDPVKNLLPDQIAWGRSPVRLDLAGGWTDTPPYCFLYGGQVVNVAVELNGQPPLHCYIKNSEKNEIVLRSIDLGARETLHTFEDIRSFENIQSAFSIPKAALALCGFLPEFATKKYTTLEDQLKSMSGGLELTILSAVPKGSGLGTSSILAATVLGTLADVCKLNWDKPEIGKRTLALEQLLTTGGGWQDQFGGLLDGIKLLETNAGKIQNPLIKWLPDSLFTDQQYKNRILLYYTGITRIAKNILSEIVRGMFLNSQAHLLVLEELKAHAYATYEVMLQKDFSAFAKMIDKSWQLNQKLDSGTNTPEITELITKIEPFILGQKLLGAGGGGFMLMLAKDEISAVKIKETLAANPTNNRARFVDFKISNTGFQVTKS